VSGIAVVLSLVYVAFQVRQNTRALRTETYARALDRVAAIQARLSGDPQLARVFQRGSLDPAVLTTDERIQFSWAFYEMFGAFEFMFHQSETGALPAEVWPRWSGTMSWWLSLPGVAAWWRARPAPFSASFTAFVEERLRAPAVDSEAARRWGEFMVSGGGAPRDEPAREG
jgi:hypothetical protein